MKKILVKQDGVTVAETEAGGSFRLPNGDTVMPVQAGWTNREFSFEEAPAPEPHAQTEEELFSMERDDGLAYLVATDWMIVRAMEAYLAEQGATKDLPADVLAERQAARDKANGAEKKAAR